MRRGTLPAIAFAAAAGATGLGGDAAHHWTYAGRDGPSHWAELDPKFVACAAGKAQSPINIRTRDVHRERLPPLIFDYRPTSLHIIDNGHSIQVDVDPGSSLRIGDKLYRLVQFHFHHPSEERIDDTGAELDMHLVHRDPEGNLAVVAVQLNPGTANSMVDAMWNHLPKQKEHKADFPDVLINPAALLPADRGYFTYTGSLTTPPCSEGVRWIILKAPSSLSKGEIAAFAARYPNDARPVQNQNGREVLTGN